MTALRAVNSPKSRYLLVLIINRWMYVSSCMTITLLSRFAQVYRGLEIFDWIVYGVGNYYTARAYSQLRLQIL